MIELIIENYPVFMRLGCYASEHLAGQRVLVSLSVHSQAPERDKLTDALDYAGIISSIDQCLANQSLQLLETAVSNLGDFLMLEYARVRRVEVTIEKTVLPGEVNKGAHIKMRRIFNRG